MEVRDEHDFGAYVMELNDAVLVSPDCMMNDIDRDQRCDPQM